MGYHESQCADFRDVNSTSRARRAGCADVDQGQLGNDAQPPLYSYEQVRGKEQVAGLYLKCKLSLFIESNRQVLDI